jgi:hypothetical protein
MTVIAVVSHVSIRAFATGFIFVLIGVTTPLFLIANRKKRWVARAHRLARESGIDLPSSLEDRVAMRLRSQWLASLMFYPLFMGPWYFLVFSTDIQGATFWRTWFPRLAMLLPIFCVVVSFSTVVVARWNTPRSTRLSHFRIIRLREAFTPAESYTLVTGVGVTGAVVAWGLLQTHSPVRWWILDFATFALAGAVWWFMEIAILRHPSTASDELELGWDDVLRFRRVRGLAIGAAWLPPFFVFLLDFVAHQHPTHLQGATLWPVYVPIAVGGGVYMVFRQGRHLWRFV